MFSIFRRIVQMHENELSRHRPNQPSERASRTNFACLSILISCFFPGFRFWFSSWIIRKFPPSWLIYGIWVSFLCHLGWINSSRSNLLIWDFLFFVKVFWISWKCSSVGIFPNFVKELHKWTSLFQGHPFYVFLECSSCVSLVSLSPLKGICLPF